MMFLMMSQQMPHMITYLAWHCHLDFVGHVCFFITTNDGRDKKKQGQNVVEIKRKKNYRDEKQMIFYLQRQKVYLSLFLLHHLSITPIIHLFYILIYLSLKVSYGICHCKKHFCLRLRKSYSFFFSINRRSKRP